MPYNRPIRARIIPSTDASHIINVIIHQIFSLARDWSKHVTWPNIPRPQNFTFALEASLLGQMFIFRTLSQPRTLSADIPAAWRGLFTKYSPIFKTARVAKNIWRIIKTIVSIWLENMLGYLSLDIICSSMLTDLLELRSRKTVRFWRNRWCPRTNIRSYFRAKWWLLFMYYRQLRKL